VVYRHAAGNRRSGRTASYDGNQNGAVDTVDRKVKKTMKGAAEIGKSIRSPLEYASCTSMGPFFAFIGYKGAPPPPQFL